MWTPTSFFICYLLILKIIRVDSAQRQKHISVQQESSVEENDAGILILCPPAFQTNFIPLFLYFLLGTNHLLIWLGEWGLD
jgi:hypothetical protein